MAKDDDKAPYSFGPNTLASKIKYVTWMSVLAPNPPRDQNTLRTDLIALDAHTLLDIKLLTKREPKKYYFCTTMLVQKGYKAISKQAILSKLSIEIQNFYSLDIWLLLLWPPSMQ